MINFRYHVISLIAVFMALGIGVLVGSSFIAESTVKALENSQQSLGRRNDDLRARVQELERDNDLLIGYANQSLGSLIEGKLTDGPVFLAAFESTDESILTSVETALVRAGANLQGSFVLSSNLDLASDSRRQQVAIALEIANGGQAEMRGRLIEVLASVFDGDRPGALQRMIDSGLAESRAVALPDRPAPAALPTKGSAIVMVAPALDGVTDFEEQVLVPLITRLGEAGVVQMIAEPGTEDLELVGMVRDANANAATADGIDKPQGIAALILGLRDAFAGRIGDYGFGEGAQSPLPVSDE